MMKTKRIETHILNYVKSVPEANTLEILENVNRTSKHGTTLEALGPILNRLKVEKKLIKLTSYDTHRLKPSTWKYRNIDQ